MSKHLDSKSALAALVRQLLVEVGEDPERAGLTDTPNRVAEAWSEFTSGYDADVDELLTEGAFDDTHQGIVLVKDIDFYSMCEHHLVPFFGKCHVGYVPDGRVVGLSKVARLVDAFARRLQVQERMTNEIADALETHLHPRGVAVLVEAQHLCMMMRGVECDNAAVSTSTMRGRFDSDASLVTEFYGQLGRAPADPDPK